ncbi:class I SAM-dependent methyltransferase [Halorhodospira halochloris]|uniref:class I SAM-dependent methyltransferase n=1 Tax=Halorhodospira halochloris TaxID=1052 RepID=UPI001EE81B7B|nr:class I SAM-dependent methyltransferase [Halorhodospira halochloris]MCG5548661.1 methyltransferase domain-containing protein [Halorhodospira halochloris]
MTKPLTAIAHERIADSLPPACSAIDATAGNGHDTLFLAHGVGPHGRVLSIDIQSTALEHTRRRLQQHGLLERVTLIQGDHRNMRDFVEQQGLDNIRAVMFNLGYHPGGNKEITTQVPSTLSALAAALDILSANGGTLSVMAYRGHEGGAHEADEVKRFLERSSKNLPGVEDAMNQSLEASWRHPWRHYLHTGADDGTGEFFRGTLEREIATPQNECKLDVIETQSYNGPVLYLLSLNSNEERDNE